MKLAFDSAFLSWQLAKLILRLVGPVAPVAIGAPARKLGVPSVVKPEWGTKRICQECGTKFYDMRRPDIICPKCEAAFDATPPKARRVPAAAKAPVEARKPAPKPALDEDLDLADEDDSDLEDIEDVGDDDDDVDDEEDVIEDTADLGDDDDDMAEVIHKPGASEDV